MLGKERLLRIALEYMFPQVPVRKRSYPNEDSLVRQVSIRYENMQIDLYTLT